MQLGCRFKKVLWPRTEEEAARTDYIIAVYRARNGDGIWEDVVAKGNGLPTDPNLEIVLAGQMVTEQGRTAFKVSNYATSVIKTRESVLGYLSSGVIKGVGREIAKRIVDHFGVDAVDILENNPERLLEVSGIGPSVLEEIKESFYENREIHGLMQYLGQYKISVNKAKRIVGKFGARSLEIVRSDLYHLCQVDGFGFLTVDTIAQKMGHPMKTYPRVLAGSEYLLEENRDEGHLYMEPADFLKDLQKMLNKGKEKPDRFTEKELVPLAGRALNDSRNITVANGSIYLTQDYNNERTFARLMARRLVDEHRAGGDKMRYPKITGSGIQLSDEQEQAVAMALTRNTCIISGGPGTGKTTVLKTFLELYLKSFSKRDGILLCAPTGRAARRMSEATGYEAFTIHRAFMLGSEGDNIPDYKKNYDLVVVDEFSMSDQWVSTAMLSMLSPETKLIFVGDANQLPSVGPGSVLHEIIASKKIPVVHLKKVFRQASGSSIAENARRIASSITKLMYDDDFIFLPAENQDEAMGFICQLYGRAVKALGPDKVQILTPMKSRGSCSVKSLNSAIQRIVQGDPEMGYQAGPDRYYCVGDPVIQLKNVNGVNNGDLGIVREVSNEGVVVQYPGIDSPRKYDEETLRIIQLAYALTVHKSQGSEYPITIIPVLREHAFMLTRNLLYTAITRGKNRVVIVGSEWALINAITENFIKKRRNEKKEKDEGKRKTHLAKRIVAFYDKYLEESECLEEQISA